MNVSNKQIDDIIQATQPMDDDRRIWMKSTILIILMALKQPNNEILTEEWLQLWCHNELRKSFDADLVQKYFNKLLLKYRAVFLNLSIAANDELMNHQLHMWFNMTSPYDDNVPCADRKWWAEYYVKVWKKCNPNEAIDKCNPKKDLLNNKSGIFVNNINHAPVWTILNDWMMNQKIDQKLTQLANDEKEIGNICISPVMLVFFYELTLALYSRNLTSQQKKTEKINSKQTKEEWVSRSWDLSDMSKKWIQRSYCNKNGLIYTLIFNVWDSETNKINPKFKKGITPNMDPQIPLRKFHSDANVQKSILYNLSYMIMKFLIFNQLWPTSLAGAFAWTCQTIHSPTQIIFETFAKLWFAHYWHPANFDEKMVNDEDIEDQEYVDATPLERINWKYWQLRTIAIMEFSHPDYQADKLCLSSMCMHDDSNLHTLPLTTGYCCHSISTVKGFASKVKHTLTGGDPFDSIQEWETTMQTKNCITIETQPKRTAVQKESQLKRINQITMNIMSGVPCRWSETDKTKPNCFLTKIATSNLKHQYWKYFNVIPKQWNDKHGTKGVWPLYWNDKFLGYKWRARHLHQWRKIHSIEFVTCAQFLKELHQKVTDMGMKVYGNLWNINDFPKRKNTVDKNGLALGKAEIEQQKPLQYSKIFNEDDVTEHNKQLYDQAQQQQHQQAKPNNTINTNNNHNNSNNSNKSNKTNDNNANNNKKKVSHFIHMIPIVEISSDSSSDSDIIEIGNNNNNNDESTESITIKTEKKK